MVRPDGKAQVSVAYEDDRPISVETIVVSTQHAPDVHNDAIREAVIQEVILPVIPSELLDPGHCTFHINPTGQFVRGGPHGDAGLTGRKIVVDTYGGMGGARRRSLQREGRHQGRSVRGVRRPMGGPKPR